MAINVAVIGLGKMGISHLAMLNALSDFNVVAICDSNTMVGKVIEKYGRLSYITDYNKILEIPHLDAIVIATPTVTHEAMVRKAIERGAHVFCEKPLTLSSDESETLSVLASSKKLVTQVGYHNRFIGTFAEVRKLTSMGALGRVTHVLAEAYGPVVLKPSKPTWRGKSGQGGGCLYDYAAHPINLLNWYFGKPVACGGSVLKSGFSSEVDDQVYATLAFADELTGQISVNWSDPSVRKMTTRISVWGERGKIYADRQEIQVYLTGQDSIPDGYNSGWTVKYITELTPPVSFYLRGEEYTGQLEAFGKAIIDSSAERKNTFEDAAVTDATIEMIRSAAAMQGNAEAAILPSTSRRATGLISRMLGR